MADVLKAKAANAWRRVVEDAERTGEQPRQRSFAFPRLRPYLPGKRALRRLCAGFLALLLGLLRLLRKGLRVAFAAPVKEPPAKAEPPAKDEKPGAEKAKDPEKGTPTVDAVDQAAVGVLILVLAGTVAVTGATALGSRLLPYLPIITGVAIPGLLIAAWVAAHEPAPKAPPAASEEPSLDTPEGRRLAFLRWLEKTTRDTSGIHLAQMHHQLTQQEATAAFPRHYLRPLLDHYRIPVQRTLRVGKVAGRSGVTREAIVQLLQEAAQAPPLPVESGGVERVGESA